ncbi:AP-3 complex subunit mu-2 [Nowakowskiella sp. JEL0078]|nr:AP-3 complex subunit mu-2 [Nowakowskiella sp. JEL0078]
MIDTLFVLDNSGQVIIEKHWRTVIPRAAIDEFWLVVQKQAAVQNSIVHYPLTSNSQSQLDSSPVVASQDGLYFFHHIIRNGLFFVAIVSKEVPPLAIVQFLHRVVDICYDYFGGLSESIIKENFVIVYELLEELLDYGLPHITEPSILKEIVPPPSILRSVIDAVSLGSTYGI